MLSVIKDVMIIVCLANVAFLLTAASVLMISILFSSPKEEKR